MDADWSGMWCDFVIRCLYCVPYRTWWNISGIDSNNIEARIKPGYSLLRYDLLEKLVQRSVFNFTHLLFVNFTYGAYAGQAMVDFEVTKIVFVLQTGDNPNKPINPLVTGVFGAIAGAASVFGNTPLDVVKTRMQVRI